MARKPVRSGKPKAGVRTATRKRGRARNLAPVELKTPGLREGVPPRAAEAAARDVGLFLRAARESQRLTQEQLAALTAGQPWPVSRAEIGALEKGKKLPSLEFLLSLSSVLHINPLEAIERARLATVAPVDLTAVPLWELDQRARECFWRGEYRNALANYDAMLQRLVLDPPSDSVERARLFATFELRRAGTLRRCGALLAAREAAERTITLGTEWPDLQAQAYGVLAEAQIQMGNPLLATDAVNRAAELAQGCDDRIAARALLDKGTVLYSTGKIEQARATFLEARQRAERGGDAQHMTHIEGNIGVCLVDLGELADARAWIERALHLARERAFPILEARWLLEIGRIDLAESRLDESDQRAVEALDIVRPLEHWLTIFRGEWLRHLVVLRKSPHHPDRYRISLLRKLLGRLAEHVLEKDIQDFKAALSTALKVGSGRPS